MKVVDINKTYEIIKINTTGMATKYHGTSTVLPNQFTVQEVKDRVTVVKIEKKIAFFTFPPPF